MREGEIEKERWVGMLEREREKERDREIEIETEREREMERERAQERELLQKREHTCFQDSV